MTPLGYKLLGGGWSVLSFLSNRLNASAANPSIIDDLKEESILVDDLAQNDNLVFELFPLFFSEFSLALHCF